MQGLVAAIGMGNPSVVFPAASALTSMAHQKTRASLTRGDSLDVSIATKVSVPAPETFGVATRREWLRIRGQRTLLLAYSRLGAELGRADSQARESIGIHVEKGTS